MSNPLTPVSASETPPLRTQFENEEREKAIRDTRNSTVVASLLFLAFIVLDYFAFPRLFTIFVLIRLGVVILNMLIFILTRTQAGKGRPFPLAMAVYLTCALPIVFMVHLSGGYASTYYAGVNLVLVGFLFIIPIGAKRTTIVCFVVFAAYVIPIVFLQKVEHFDVFLNNTPGRIMRSKQS